MRGYIAALEVLGKLASRLSEKRCVEGGRRDARILVQRDINIISSRSIDTQSKKKKKKSIIR